MAATQDHVLHEKRFSMCCPAPATHKKIWGIIQGCCHILRWKIPCNIDFELLLECLNTRRRISPKPQSDTTMLVTQPKSHNKERGILGLAWTVCAVIQRTHSSAAAAARRTRPAACVSATRPCCALTWHAHCLGKPAPSGRLQAVALGPSGPSVPGGLGRAAGS